jgi:hypothetical protein
MFRKQLIASLARGGRGLTMIKPSKKSLRFSSLQECFILFFSLLFVFLPPSSF